MCFRPVPLIFARRATRVVRCHQPHTSTAARRVVRNRRSRPDSRRIAKTTVPPRKTISDGGTRMPLMEEAPLRLSDRPKVLPSPILSTLFHPTNDSVRRCQSHVFLQHGFVQPGGHLPSAFLQHGLVQPGGQSLPWAQPPHFFSQAQPAGSAANATATNNPAATFNNDWVQRRLMISPFDNP